MCIRDRYQRRVRGSPNAEMSLRFVLFTLAILACASAELDFIKADELGALLDSTDEQVVLGISSRGQCGEPCELFAKFLTQLSAKMTGFFKVVLVDVATQVKIGSEEMSLQALYNVTMIPMMQVLPYGLKDLKNAVTLSTNSTSQLIQVYSEGKQNQQVHNVFLQFLPKGEVAQLSSSDLEEFISEEPSKGRVLLITAKSSTPPMFTKLALDHGNGLKFGSVRSGHTASLDKLREMGVNIPMQKFPKLLISGPGGSGSALQEYQGPLTINAIGAALQAINPGTVVNELLSSAMFDDTCVKKGGICIVALLPSRFDKHLDAFTKVASRKFSSAGGSTQLPVTNFAWVNADRQEAFAEGFGLDMFPGVVALNPRKKLYSAMKGTFEQAQVRDFVSRVLQGKESLSKLESVPKLQKMGASLSSAKMDAMMGREL
eukprot:TRINITY_DN8417_c0_g1_i1.p1 TRINITY_DN8417_c0_g1~~TRINITY_DN8417_c0_g1_i1.p1  ORF type:complete len:431 (+),score=161.81 TRINITY_DN8417_c0_g1_i1:88-1380(+)